MHDTDSSKRVPKALGTETKLFGNYTLTDLAVALVPGVAVVLLIQVVFPPSLTVAGYRLQTLTLPVVLVSIACGGVFVFLTPTYTTSLEWIETFVGFSRREKRLNHDAAKRHTQFERVHPEHGAIERIDGAIVGMVQVNPPPMALATDEEWAAKTDAFRDFCNTVVEFPIQIYSTTQPFPVEEYLGQYRSRLDDPDVKANPRLGALIEQYLSWYATDLEARRMTIRDHYVVVSVTPEEVHFERESLTEKLATLPVVGLFVDAWFAPRAGDERAAMFDALAERLRRVEAGLRDIEGCSARTVDVAEATTLIAEFWSGEPRERVASDQQLRTRPIVGGSR
ncbi:hypothetical protein [Haloarcula montana]|uniref:hypothetical protein n=1 Tax=Haloarcula montana TaxID=3111776 RepID=UPI002D766130|nr:hypothetical protein [Haloarcula sp. GH36]